MPGTPELRVVDPHSIGEEVTIKQADGGLGSSAVHSKKCLKLVVGYMLLSSLTYVSFNLSFNREIGMKRTSAGFFFVSFRHLARSVCSLLLCQKRSERIMALG